MGHPGRWLGLSGSKAGICGLQQSFTLGSWLKHALCVLDSSLGVGRDSLALEQPASSWHVEDTDVKTDPRDPASLLQTESYLAPTGLCTCPLLSSSGRSGICRACLRVACAAMALLTVFNGDTAIVNKKPSMQSFFLLQPPGWLL